MINYYGMLYSAVLVAINNDTYSTVEGEAIIFCVTVLSGEIGQKHNITISTTDVTAVAGGDHHLF